LSLNYIKAPAICNKNQKKKSAGPPTPATTIQGKKFKKTKPAAEKKPARLTARGPWATAHGAKPTARDASATGHGPRTRERASGAEGLVYRVFFTTRGYAVLLYPPNEKPAVMRVLYIS